jgi:hypothetical protein
MADAQLGRDAQLTQAQRDYYSHWCPQADANLAGTLGIKEAAAMGAQTPRLPPESADQPAATQSPNGTAAPPPPQSAAATTAFGDTIQFVVTKNVSGVGPTRTTRRFKGPGGLLALPHVNTDKIILSIAEGPNVGLAEPLAATPPNLVKATPLNVGAYNFLQQQLTQSIDTQLNTLLNRSP